ncbi:MAG: ribonuclease H-like domain-containing protein [Bacteroidia bacterium]|nr:ribonuclease H-like domain-containing protein [Bacteroidia bacterium]MDW8015472.1 ribonuclease H-like domain-containing protein [Bacteroidia bacterium]
MATNLPVEKILFFDIETAPLYQTLDEVPPLLREHWERRYEAHRPQGYKELSADEYFLKRCGIHALYARVICISLGYFVNQHGSLRWRQTSFYNLDEKELLLTFLGKWEKFREHASTIFQSLLNSRPKYAVCGHNVLGFDIPFIGRRLLLNQVSLPAFWREAQYAQPWQLEEPAVIDTMLLWNFTSREGTFLSLELLAHILGMDFQKSLNHEEIHSRFSQWASGGDEASFLPVVEYCERDVRAVAEIYIRMQLPQEKQKIYIESLRVYESSHHGKE